MQMWYIYNSYCSINRFQFILSFYYISLVSAFDSFLLCFVDTPMIQFYRGLIKMNLSFVILNKLCTVKIGLVFIYIYTIWVVCFYTLSMFICEDVVVYKCTVLNIWQLSHYLCIQDLQTFISFRRMHATIFMHLHVLTHIVLWNMFIPGQGSFWQVLFSIPSPIHITCWSSLTLWPKQILLLKLTPSPHVTLQASQVPHGDQYPKTRFKHNSSYIF